MAARRALAFEVAEEGENGIVSHDNIATKISLSEIAQSLLTSAGSFSPMGHRSSGDRKGVTPW